MKKITTTRNRNDSKDFFRTILSMCEFWPVAADPALNAIEPSQKRKRVAKKEIVLLQSINGDLSK